MTATINANATVKKITETVRTHSLGNGNYTRYTLEGEKKNNEYGCADAANILYTVGEFERDEAKRKAALNALRAFQDPETGLFDEGTHHPIHCTAHCTAALELFDAAPLYPFNALKKYSSVKELYALLDSLEWVNNPWPAAHAGAGIYAAFVLTGEADEKWSDAYFDYLESNADPETGIGKRGAVKAGAKPVNHHLNGWFHYLFNFSFARRPFPYAERLIDECIKMYDEGIMPPSFGQSVGFQEIDWVYALNRAASQTGYRFAEAKDRLRKFAHGYFEFIQSVPVTNKSWDDLHMLFGLSCAVAELQLALPGEIRTDYPLKNVLDRRPFI